MYLPGVMTMPTQNVLIDRAAEVVGKNRSDFMLETACREAEAILLDRRFFALEDEKFKQFLALLDAPPGANEELRTLLMTCENCGFTPSPIAPMTLLVAVADAEAIFGL